MEKQKCIECGESFSPSSASHPNQRYCSKRCIKRAWARRDRQLHPEKKTVAGGRPSRATLEKLQPGQCRKCREIFPQTVEHFVLLKNKPLNWEGWSAECRTCRYERFKQHYAANRDRHVKRVIEYVQNNPHARAKKNSRDMVRYMRIKKSFGCPPWADQKKIETIYMLADYLTEQTGIAYEVDHVYPLIHPTSCGLHVPWNMRIITAKANQAKGNRLKLWQNS